MNKTLQNILSFGASGRIEKAQHEYEANYEEYKEMLAEYNVARSNFEQVATSYLPLQIKAQKLAKKIDVFIPTKDKEGRKEIVRKIGFDVESMAFLENSISSGEIAMNTLKGVAGAGIAAASAPAAIMGLVTAFGTASTGAAISSLSGAAATNAALAALGGGSLAAGGGGVAAGSALLSASVPVVGVAIAAIALPVFSHLSANKKIKAIEEEMLKVTREIDNVKTEKFKVDYCISRIMELSASLKESEKAYKHLFYKTYRKVFPLGILSKFIKKLQGKIKKQNGYYYSEQEQHSIHVLLKAAKAMLMIRDTNVIREFENTRG